MGRAGSRPRLHLPLPRSQVAASEWHVSLHYAPVGVDLACLCHEATTAALLLCVGVRGVFYCWRHLSDCVQPSGLGHAWLNLLVLCLWGGCP